MVKLTREVLGLLDKRQRRAFVTQQGLVLLMAICELVGVAAIGPFMALVGNPRIIESNALLERLYAGTGLNSVTELLIAMGAAVLLTLAVSSALSVYTLWKNALLSSQVGEQLAESLFSYYLHQPWLFHSTTNSSELSARITAVDTFTQSVLQPLVNIVARSFVVAFIAIPLIFFNPQVALIGLGSFTLAYVVLYRKVRHRLLINGVSTSAINHQRHELRAEAFGGIRDILLLHRQGAFTLPFHDKGQLQVRNYAMSHLLTQFPRYLIELLAFGTIIFLVLFLLRAHAGNLGEILPILGIYALGSFKLLPAFQSIYISLAQIRSGIGAFDFIKDDLQASQGYKGRPPAVEDSSRIAISRSIRLKNIRFNYPDKTIPALRGLDIEFPVNQVIGLVGSSGSGKSTAVDVLLGLIRADSGQILVDGEPLVDSRLRAWQNSLGFVPQSLFLSNTSIIKNIAFGLSPDEIDPQRVARAVKLAHLEDYIAQLPDGLDTQVGERGVQLSGGQRQRIGIARALYNDADVLILDEATSSLDGITETIIMDAIHDFSGKKTIIMIAHRLTTVRNCDVIFLIDQGRVLDQGSYDELFQRSERFREMAGHRMLPS